MDSEKTKNLDSVSMADESERSSIEVRLVSGEDIRAFNFFQNLSLFALASIAAEDPTTKAAAKAQLQRSPTDRENDAFPEWNHDVVFSLDSDSDPEDSFLHLEIRHEGGIFWIGDRTVGEVRIPVKDLTDEASSGGVLRFVRYQVRTSDGKPNGLLNLSYRFRSRRSLPASDLYPKVEHVDDLNLIADSNLSYFSPRFQVDDRLWPSPPQTASLLYPPPPPPPPHHHHHHHLQHVVPHASFGYGEAFPRERFGW